MIKRNRVFVIFLLCIVLSFVFVFFMDFSLIKTTYSMYYGDSSISEFFEEQGQNIFSDSVRITLFKLLISRFIYSVIPIIISLFFLIIYHTKKNPDSIMNKKIFKDNPHLSVILIAVRYILGVLFFFLFLCMGRDFIDSTFHNCLLGRKMDFIRILLGSVALVVPIIDWRKFLIDLKKFPQNYKKLTVLLMMIVISVDSCCLVEFQIGSKMNVLDYLIHINIFYWFLLQLILLAVFRNAKPGAIVSLLFSYIIGLANDVVYQFRGNYIMFGDITVVRTALEVAGNYRYKPTMWFWISLMLLIISVLVVSIIKMPKDAFVSSSIAKRIISTAIIEFVLVLFVVITFKTGSFYGKVFGVGWDYNKNVSVVGYLPYFFSNMDSTNRVRVDGYSSEEVSKIFDESLNGKADIKNDDSTYGLPNIILIQNEAFSDLSIMTDIKTDVDPLEYIHSMTDNTEKGYLNMSITGGPTSNTEFEVLSRSSLQFFPYGSVPYTQYLKQNIPSVVEVLEKQENPYHTVAYHSYYSSGYNRNSVYDYLGFDEKIFENNFFDDYPESDLPRGYLSDEANYRRVIKAFEDNQKTDDPFFCFNVTIQGHGGYMGGPFNLPEKVNVTNFDADETINTYLSCIKMSDTAFKNLVEYFDGVDEPTIIMMYGDHQPSFEESAKGQLAEHPAWNDGTMQALSEYYVPYIIWANYDIEESDLLKGWNEKAEDYYGDNVDETNGINALSTNYVSSYLLCKAGVKLSPYDEYLLSLHDEVPAITAIGVWDIEGNYYGNASSSPFSDKLSDLEKIQYNLIFDADNKQMDAFLP